MSDNYYVRNGVDAVLWGFDFSYKLPDDITTNVLEFVYPYMKQRIGRIKNHFGMPVFLHACGNNWKLLANFIEMGVDCYESIQPSAEMDIKKLKEAFGSKLTLWGGVPVELLVSGSMGEV